MRDLIDRQAAIDAICKNGANLERDKCYVISIATAKQRAVDIICDLPSAQHFCRECKWVKYHGRVDKYGNVESYWRCCNWDGETDEEGFCHEWEGTQ